MSTSSSCDGNNLRKRNSNTSQPKSDKTSFSKKEKTTNIFEESAMSSQHVRDHGRAVRDVHGNVYLGDQNINYTTVVERGSSLNQKDIKKNVKDLKELVLKTAKENCSYDGTILDGSPITSKYVRLQISQYQESNDSELHNREVLMNRSKTTPSTVEPKDFFQKSHEHILTTPDYENIITREAKQKFLYEKGNIVCCVGGAGFGKSTLMKHLLIQTVNEKERLYEADFVFYVKLRDFFDKTEINLFQFLMGNKACESLEWMKNSDIRNDVLKLLEQTESVCILLDGFDEANIDTTVLNQSEINFSLFDQNRPENFILGILRGQIFPKAKKIVTSRPKHILDLPDIYKPKFIVEIRGIYPEGIEQVCRNITGELYSSQIFLRIKNQPNLLSYCYIPINCVLTVYCFHRCLELGMLDELLPNNISSVFVMIFNHFYKSNHINRKGSEQFEISTDFEKLCKLAWKGMQNQQFYFDDKDLNDAGLTAMNITGFTVAIKHEDRGTKFKIIDRATKTCIYSSHLLLQEFLAAVYCLYFMKLKDFKATFFQSRIVSFFYKIFYFDLNQFNLAENRFEMLTKFLFGLSNPEIFKQLKEICPDIPEPTNRIRELKNFAKKTAANAKEDEISTLLNVCSFAFELQDSEFCKLLSKVFPQSLKIGSNFLPSDIVSVCYIIKSINKHLDLCIRSNISDNSLETFCKEVDNVMATSSYIKIKQINLIGKPLNDEKFKLVLSLIKDGIQLINLRGCGLSEQAIKMITTKISLLDHNIERLWIHDNHIGEGGFVSISSIVHKIDDWLDIGDMGDKQLTLGGVVRLIDAIQNRPQARMRLWIHCPPEIEDEVVKESHRIVGKVDLIWINDREINDDYYSSDDDDDD